MHKTNDANTSDGVVWKENGYKYAIRYSSEENKEALKLHTLDEMKAGKATLQNYRETYANQDVGLIKVNDLEISKTVVANTDTTGVELDDLKEDEFTFNIELKHDGKSVYAEFDYEISDSGSGISPISFFKRLVGANNDPKAGKLKFDVTGKASFKLKHGEKITIKNLPVGATYTVTEVKSAGYDVCLLYTSRCV